MTRELIKRSASSALVSELQLNESVILLGPRRVGKTTLAKQIAQSRPSVYYSLERRSKKVQELAGDTNEVLSKHTGKLIIIDEVHKIPELFGAIMDHIDTINEEGFQPGQFLLLGSASKKLLQQSQSLTGRVETLYLHGLNLLEVGGTKNLERLFARGGLPRSYSAPDEKSGNKWLTSYVEHLIYEDVPDLGVEADPEKLLDLMKLVAFAPGRIIKTKVASTLGISDTSVENYLRTLKKLLLVNKIRAYDRNVSKQVRKLPKYYLCDSGLVRNLCGTRDRRVPHQELQQNLGLRWEGFVIENLLSVLPHGWKTYYYRTHDGDKEIDLLIQTSDDELWAIEIKWPTGRRVTSSFVNALGELKPDRAFILYGGTVPRQKKLKGGYPVEVLSLEDMMQELVAQQESY